MFFVAQFGKRFGKRIETVPPKTMKRLSGYAWPGNIRELQNVIERAVVLCQGTVLDLDEDLLPVPVAADVADPAVADSRPPSSAAGLGSLEEVERAHILPVRHWAGWLIEGPRGAARILALHPNTLRSRMNKLGLKRPRHDIS